ncbi:MAG: MBL fold metallo-hydrolase, partial [Candidatus Binatia bacterium]
AYLSGDTGIHTEMKTVVNDFHKANLAVLNLGPSAVTPASAAHAVNELIRPVAVIATHVNEAATSGGKVRPNSRTAVFIKLSKRPVHLALSGRTMEFDGSGKCGTGCN